MIVGNNERARGVVRLAVFADDVVGHFLLIYAEHLAFAEILQKYHAPARQKQHERQKRYKRAHYPIARKRCEIDYVANGVPYAQIHKRTSAKHRIGVECLQTRFGVGFVVQPIANCASARRLVRTAGYAMRIFFEFIGKLDDKIAAVEQIFRTYRFFLNFVHSYIITISI